MSRSPPLSSVEEQAERERKDQDALRTSSHPIGNSDPRLEFYKVYNKEATERDTEYVRKYNEDLNTALIFVRGVYSRYIFSLRIL